MPTLTAIYPGTFDPITRGHTDLVERALHLFDKVIVAVAENKNKAPVFSQEERMQMATIALENLKGVEILPLTGLLVDFAKQHEARAILRGLRAVSDFEYEFQLALMNRKLNRDVQSVFLMTDYKWFYTSSTIIKEAAKWGGDISGLVPPLVCKKLKEKYGF